MTDNEPQSLLGQVVDRVIAELEQDGTLTVQEAAKRVTLESLSDGPA